MENIYCMPIFNTLSDYENSIWNSTNKKYMKGRYQVFEGKKINRQSSYMIHDNLFTTC
jgi:hypothetical protein